MYTDWLVKPFEGVLTLSPKKHPVLGYLLPVRRHTNTVLTPIREWKTHTSTSILTHLNQRRDLSPQGKTCYPIIVIISARLPTKVINLQKLWLFLFYERNFKRPADPLGAPLSLQIVKITYSVSESVFALQFWISRGENGNHVNGYDNLLML